MPRDTKIWYTLYYVPNLTPDIAYAKFAHKMTYIGDDFLCLILNFSISTYINNNI